MRATAKHTMATKTKNLIVGTSSMLSFLVVMLLLLLLLLVVTILVVLVLLSLSESTQIRRLQTNLLKDPQLRSCHPLSDDQGILCTIKQFSFSLQLSGWLVTQAVEFQALPSLHLQLPSWPLSVPPTQPVICSSDSLIFSSLACA